MRLIVQPALALLVASSLGTAASAFQFGVTTVPPVTPRSSSSRLNQAVEVEREEATTQQQQQQPPPVHQQKKNKYWEICPSLIYPKGRPLTSALEEAMRTNTHPIETQEELGRGISITSDWRENWSSYGEDSEEVDTATGYANYELDEIEGIVPDDLVGVLYRNGPGKFGVGGERVQHTLDADALVYKIEFPPSTPSSSSKDASKERTIQFTSSFVQTEGFQQEQAAGKFLYRGTFGTGPTNGMFDADRPKDGLNTDPSQPSLLAKVFGSAGNVNIKNAANTQIISFGGKLLTLFEAGLPHRLDPQTLETLGEDTLGGVLEEGLPVKLPDGIPTPDFIGGSAHTAHPNVCPSTGNLVGWHWSAMVADNNNLQITLTEYSADNFEPIATKTYLVPGCELAPHDMAITDDYIIINVNALTMNQVPFLLGTKGPAESLAMNGRAPIQTWVFPRPTSSLKEFEPFVVETPPCFCIHHSHAYQDETTGNLVTYFTGWPPSDSKDFLGAWGGYAPEFYRIPITYLWKQEIDIQNQRTVSLEVAPGCANACVEHVLTHPNFITKKAQYVYGTVSNFIGDSTPPNGYARLKVEEEGQVQMLTEGEYNEEIEAYWFGTRYFTTEPLIVPKEGGDLEDENQAYLVGVVRDAVAKRNFVAVFDLEKDLSVGPVCKIWLKTGVPHGIHGCFAKNDEGGPSVFC